MFSALLLPLRLPNAAVIGTGGDRCRQSTNAFEWLRNGHNIDATR